MKIRSKILWLVALFFIFFAQVGAAETILLGLGYDRAKSGHGFDLHKAGDTYVLYFYTYGEDGQPEWYIGTGNIVDAVLTGDFLKVTYDPQANPSAIVDPDFDGQFSLDFTAGSASLACQDGVDRSDAEQLATFYWEINGESSTWCSEFIRIGVETGINPYLGGVWYAGALDSGYGFTMAHMDNTVVAIAYYYDSAGLPRWALGTGNVNDTAITLNHFDGFCRSCTPVTVSPAVAGTLTLDWDRLTPAGSGQDSGVLDLTYPGAGGGDFDRNFGLYRISDGATSTEITIPAADPQAFFDANVSSDVVQGKCTQCHVSGGVAQGTRMVFERDTVSGYQATNMAVFAALLDEAGADYVLNKVRGVSHGGGTQLPSDSVGYADLVQLFDLLGSQTQQQNTEALLDGVRSMSWSRTLRRAAIIIAGRLPTAAEKSTAAGSNESAFRATLKQLLSGDGFHRFLLEGANDRLLTEKWQRENLVNPIFELYYPRLNELANQFYTALGVDAFSEQQGVLMFDHLQALGREPLELIAYVVENDRPYSEILTANYTVVNPFLNLVYDAGVDFGGSSDTADWRVATNKGALTLGEDLQYICDGSHCEYLSGGQVVDYQHAGVLNTLAYLARYPSTDTNRNRARSRWTNYFFLGLDIEKSASRTTDPDALADTQNPTLNNTNCSVCHTIMDPVAGAFQNFGDSGLYRDQFGGGDALSQTYKYPEDGSPSLYQAGDTWYRDMRVAGFGNDIAPSNANSLQWLAGKMVADSRFASGSVKFWWPAFFGREPLEAPEESADAGFDTQLAAYEAQNQYIETLATGFRQGFNGGSALNLRDLFVEILLGPWFRADAIEGQVTASKLATLEQAYVGAEKLLTPLQLERKTQLLTGLAWDEQFAEYFGRTFRYAALSDGYTILFGGIDSRGIIKRIPAVTSIMHNVAIAQAHEMSCTITTAGMLVSPSRNTLFAGLERYTTPLFQGASEQSHSPDGPVNAQEFELQVQLNAGSNLLHIEFLNDFYVDAQQDSNLGIDWMELVQNGSTITRVEAEQAGQLAGADSPCGFQSGDSWVLSSNCWLRLPVTVPSSGTYTFRARVWADQAGPEDVRFLQAVYENSAPQSAQTLGRTRIMSTLQSWHDQFFGKVLATGSPELLASYSDFVDTWLLEVQATPSDQANIFARPCKPLEDGTDFSIGNDPHLVLYTLIDTITAFMSDFRYIYE